LPLIDLASIPNLPLSAVNADHADEARLLNEAADAVDRYQAGTAGREAVIAALDALYAHTREHFGREEALMQSSSFPEASLHAAEHVRVLVELDAAERAFKDTGDATPLVKYLRDTAGWFEEHLLSMDLATARFAKEWGA